MYQQPSSSYAGLVEKLNFFGYTTPSYSTSVNYSFSGNPQLNTIDYSGLEQQIMQNYSTNGSGASREYTINLDAPLPLITDKRRLDIAYGLGYANAGEKAAERSYEGTNSSIDTAVTYRTQQQRQQAIRFVPDTFLLDNRPSTPFIGKAEEVESYVRDAFERTTGVELSDGLFQLQIASGDEFKKHYFYFSGGSDQPAQFSPGILGFCINRFPQMSYIFIREDNLDRLLLTIGHEVGHALSPALSDPRDEEAKAFAFSLAWMKTIAQHNIADLASNIMPNPAKNNLHDVAFSFVVRMMQKKDLSELEIYELIKDGLLRVDEE